MNQPVAQQVQAVASGTEHVALVDDTLLAKLAQLESILAERAGVLVAYSGGVDSALIAAAGMKALGAHTGPGLGTLAVLADSSTLARRELTLARATADQIGVPLLEVKYSELANAEWAANDGMRCYHCKADLGAELAKVAPAEGYSMSQVAFGITTSDLGDYRPGIQATKDAGAWHPLVEAGLSKPEVRALAAHLGLPVWDKPATPCLASRVQYGESITEQTLLMIETAEESVRSLGFSVCRVRHHDRLARVEVPEAEIARAFSQRAAIIAALKEAGYTYVTLDLMGFRSGAMNEALSLPAQNE